MLLKSITKQTYRHSKSDKGIFAVIVDRDNNIKKIETLISDQSKFQKATERDDQFVNFITSQENCINKIYKKLVNSKEKKHEDI